MVAPTATVDAAEDDEEEEEEAAMELLRRSDCRRQVYKSIAVSVRAHADER